jgi:hypothetical protein
MVDWTNFDLISRLMHLRKRSARQCASFINLLSLFYKKCGNLRMASLVELLVVLISSLGFNLIPFASPSNLFISSNSALILGVEDPATLAKSIHYLITFFVSKHLREKQRQRLEAESRAHGWSFHQTIIPSIAKSLASIIEPENKDFWKILQEQWLPMIKEDGEW